MIKIRIIAQALWASRPFEPHPVLKSLPSPLSNLDAPSIYSAYILTLNTQRGLDFLLKEIKSIKIFDQMDAKMQIPQKREGLQLC